VLAGKYRVERVLGQGGMGVVVAASHLQLRQRVAIKFLLPEAMQHPGAVERFLREARAAVRLKSEHVARVIDVGELESGAPYMVMEYLEGADLSEVLQKSGTLPVEETVDYVLQACEAIAEAHVVGIVHRDLKPANLFRTTGADGRQTIKVLDFGISKVNEGEEGGMALTKTSTLLGSPLYMSPEAMRSARDVDARSDQWALGVILYELLTGQPPFTAEAITELVYKVMSETPPPPRAPLGELPPALCDAILRALSKDRSQRYASIGEFAWALSDFGSANGRRLAEKIARIFETSGARVESPSALPPASIAAASPTTATWSPNTEGKGNAPTHGARRAMGIFAAVVVLAVLGGIVVYSLPTSAPTAEPALAVDTPIGPGPVAPAATSDRVEVIPTPDVPTSTAAASAAPTTSAPVGVPPVHSYGKPTGGGPKPTGAASVLPNAPSVPSVTATPAAPPPPPTPAKPAPPPANPLDMNLQ
jgi:serine/threonine-protein kinase